MKKKCKYCGGDLFCVHAKDKIGRPQFTLYCKNIECGRHNQYCKKDEVKLYDKKKETQEFLPLFAKEVYNSCGICKWFKNPDGYKSFCELSGEKKDFLSAKCNNYQEVQNV